MSDEIVLLGFGGRAPAAVCEIVSSAVKNDESIKIRLQRSQNMTHALCQAPYRVFVGDQEQNQGQDFSIIYCLPDSETEYLNFQHEAAQVRSTILSSSSSPVVAIYNPRTDNIEGGDASKVLAALQKGDSSSDQQELAAASLHALSKLDLEASSGLMRKNDTVIVVGSGGREHALAVALARSPLVGQVLCCPGNGGTAVEGGKIRNVGPGDQSIATVIGLVQQYSAKMVAVGPEAPLVEGLVDELAIKCPGCLAFGPTKAAAELEASKAFSKDFLQEHGIPTAKYKTFTDVNEAVAYVESLDESDRQVVKASGLAAGKGVIIPTTKQETVQAVKDIMSDKTFGAAGDTCVIESFLTGPEASCMALCDGKTAKLMPAAQDHKRALDNDQGLNTGGMGAYAPAPCVTPDLQKEITAMCVKTVEKMAARGTPYIGVLYAGLMLTPTGPQMLEFNCRFGDPEAQVLLPLLETDLYEVMKACCTGTLDSIDMRFKEDTAAATIVCAAKGYPLKYPKGMEITGLDVVAKTLEKDVKVYHAGTKVDADGETTRCSGGRVLAVTGMGKGLKDALKSAYKGVSKLDFVDSKTGEHLLHRRTDIGKRAVQKKMRIGVLGSTRGTALIPVIEACANGTLDCEIVAVISNRSKAPILDKGRALGPTVVTKFVSAKGLSRSQYDAECTAALLGAGVEFVLLVGYMRILSAEFCNFWKGQCINVHPSLLPKHAGGMDLEVHQAVLDAKEDETGCTIHEVTEDVDGGPVVVQKKVKVEIGESAESLKAKVQVLEGPAFVEAIQMYRLNQQGGQAISYADAGVSIDAGNKLVELIKPFCKDTRRSGCDADLGGFGGLFELSKAGYDAADTVLIGATDGVGTKLRIAQATGCHESVGIDLVAMCVNDLIVAGGEPLFFLDYFATGKLEVHEAAAVVKGIAEGCKQAGCGLIGGETAEMPSMYAPGDYDLAGFSVGAVRKGGILPSNVCSGDVIIGLPSSGIHSNGFSLVRKLIEKEGLKFSSPCPWDSSVSSIGDSLLTPTKIYVKACLPLLKEGLIKGLSHITGGGLLENLPRSLPSGVAAEVSYHPNLPPVFKWMKNSSGLDDTEMLRTFNCGIGMVLILAPENLEAVKSILASNGEKDVYELGALVDGDQEVIMKSQLA